MSGAEPRPAPAVRGAPRVLDRRGFDALVETLAGDGFRVLVPTERDQAIVFADAGAGAGGAALPEGRGDEQAPARYRLRDRGDGACFGYAVGPTSAKDHFFPPSEELWRAQGTAHDFAVTRSPEDPSRATPVALVGVRACDLHAIAIQDRVFTGGEHRDGAYARRRAAACIVAVECGAPAATCFCTALGTGPGLDPTTGAGALADLVLTELLEPEHLFLARPGTARGAALLARLPTRAAGAADLDAARVVVARAAAAITRTLPVVSSGGDVGTEKANAPGAGNGLRDLLAATLEHPRWDDVAQRCLSCTNCTLVCPTCFCAAVEDHTTLDGAAVRSRRWDSCFTLAHSYVHGGAVRPTVRGRYRQWLTHKLGTWWDQFGTSGCVGCGRCITWCPAAIDLTEELHALAGDQAR